ncbi:MAG TPA: hypothetical protein PLD20_15675 [Blastocatellia bacterium]|nr:hypothetical protein [Blastocatellia bacterium]HMV85881.1 hypothetical protein [Blastocatellia bacterium]HMX26799.1 hypothetical protein [Blastocatellia bacterium]HMY72430.1 hypothetical protein [Blastocatellia bacterium]HMZ19376.1 hypothetical protein [Blastocatellia bacterium]
MSKSNAGKASLRCGLMTNASSSETCSAVPLRLWPARGACAAAPGCEQSAYFV